MLIKKISSLGLLFFIKLVLHPKILCYPTPMFVYILRYKHNFVVGDYTCENIHLLTIEAHPEILQKKKTTVYLVFTLYISLILCDKFKNGGNLEPVHLCMSGICINIMFVPLFV